MYKRILVPLDGSETASNALQESIALALQTGAVLRLLYVEDAVAHTSFSQDVLDSAVLLCKQRGASAESRIDQAVGSTVAKEIIREALKWRADLIVMGTHGRRGITRAVLGSDAEAVVRASPIPVLLVRNGRQTQHGTNVSTASDAG